ncbi:MAG: PrsW family intramembrane metalloprotease [Candidatus Coatesbacteria bacterium]|nr:PrsW family intramembrane metalloprotease [Candidatus Coatesbacteria bacterium]
MVRSFALRILNGPDKEVSFLIGEGEFIIGKEENSNIIIHDNQLSIKHAKIVSSEAGLLILDLGSTSGSFLNEKLIQSPKFLKNGDIIRLGSTNLKVEMLPYGKTVPAIGEVRISTKEQEETLFKMGDYKITPLRMIVLLFATMILIFGGSILALFMGFISGAKHPKIIAMGAFLAGIPLIPYLYIIHLLDYHRRISFFFIISTIAWGGIAATGAALFINTFSSLMITIFTKTLSSNPNLPSLLVISGVAPIVEEFLKGLGLIFLFIFLKDKFANTLDGILYGLTIGLGFAIVENGIYFINLAQSNDLNLKTILLAKSNLGQIFYSRSLFLATICHPAWTGIIGFSLGRMRELPKDKLRFVYPFIGITIAVMLHSLWNGIGFFAKTESIKEAISIRIFSAGLLAGVLIILQIYWALYKEQKVVKEFLSDLVDPTIVNRDELKNLIKFGRGYMQGFKTLFFSGWTAFYLTRILYRLQVKLAFRKWILHLKDSPLDVKLNDPETKEIIKLIRFYRTRLER